MVVGAGFALDGVRRALKASRGIGVAAIHREFAGQFVRGEVERVDFPCYVLCTSCRNVQPEAPEKCPGCGSSAWLELDLVEMTRQLREAEEFEEDDPLPWAKWLGRGLVLGVAALTVGLAVWFGLFDEILASYPLVFGVPLVFGIGVFAFWAGSAAGPGIATLIHESLGGRQLLLRWAIPTGHVDGPLAGKVETDEPLTSPLSRQPCAVWLLTAHLRAPGDRRYRQVLVEYRSAPLRIGDRSFRRDTFALEARPRTPVGLSDADQVRVLRERGLQWSDGDFLIREAVLPVGATAKLTTKKRRGREIVALQRTKNGKPTG